MMSRSTPASLKKPFWLPMYHGQLGAFGEPSRPAWIVSAACAPETASESAQTAPTIRPARIGLDDAIAIAVLLLEHDPEKWIPVFGKDRAPTTKSLARQRPAFGFGQERRRQQSQHVDRRHDRGRHAEAAQVDDQRAGQERPEERDEARGIERERHRGRADARREQLRQP